MLLEALESKGVVRTLAEPNLTALSGQEAKFLAGGEYPIPVSDNDGITITYKPFGVEMNFTPVVVDGDLINLQINAAVSSIDADTSIQTDGISVNAFKRRETSTTVEMRDGESFAIAGLLQDDFRDLNGRKARTNDSIASSHILALNYDHWHYSVVARYWHNGGQWNDDASLNFGNGDFSVRSTGWGGYLVVGYNF